MKRLFLQTKLLHPPCEVRFSLLNRFLLGLQLALLLCNRRLSTLQFLACIILVVAFASTYLE